MTYWAPSLVKNPRLCLTHVLLGPVVENFSGGTHDPRSPQRWCTSSLPPRSHHPRQLRLKKAQREFSSRRELSLKVQILCKALRGTQLLLHGPGWAVRRRLVHPCSLLSIINHTWVFLVWPQQFSRLCHCTVPALAHWKRPSRAFDRGRSSADSSTALKTGDRDTA